MTPNRLEARRVRALLLKQERLCLEVQGYVIRDGQKLGPADWRAAFRRDLGYRLRDKVRPYNRGTNASRAADILKHGAASRWFDARDSELPQGDDRRGIVHYLRKWQRERGLTYP